MLSVFQKAPDLYAKIKAAADDGYKNAAQYMDDYIAFAEKREELEKAYYESLTQVSFDNVYDSFIDMLMDMDASWKDMADDMSEYLMRALLKTKIDEELKAEMEEWYKAFGEAMTDNLLSESEKENLSDWWNDIVNKGLSIRDNVASITGYAPTGNEGEQQSASSRGFETMSQDSADELNGRFTALYESNLRIEGAAEGQTTILQNIYELLSGQSLKDLISLPENTTNIDDISTKIRKDIIESYHPKINVAFPTAQLDSLVSKVSEVGIKVDELVRFGAENSMTVQTIEENTGKIAQQIPKQGENIARTINSKL